ncbi:MAG: hypothetical protein SFV22_20330 [Saprospiraceae bacterium]|nr:hypothetical protein [Saprospiraceae bacterium]
MKNNLIVLFCHLCLIFSMPLGAQTIAPDKITAVKLTPEIGKSYLEQTSVQAFTVNQNYILRPASGYKISYFPSEKKIAIHPVAMKLTSSRPSLPGFDTSPVPGGTMFCLCEQTQDDCKISARVIDKSLTFVCVGSCGCESFLVYDTSDPVLEYETGGIWHRF